MPKRCCLKTLSANSQSYHIIDIAYLQPNSLSLLVHQVSRFRSQAKSRIDSSDPTPEVHRQSRSLKELEILPGREKFNPRFATRGGVRRHKSSLPANIGHTTPTPADPHKTGKHFFSRSTTAPVIRVPTVPKQVQEKMETVRETTPLVEDDGVIVKLKQLPMTTQGSGNNTEHFPSSMAHGASQSGCERDCQESRDSVSSSEDVGVDPEDCSVEVVTDAFAVETEHQRERKEKCSKELQGDKIVGLEVSTDETQTTVNLLHLLRHKNKSVEQTRTEYRNHELWVIGEEEDEEEEEEEESDGESGGDPETIAISSQPVPQLFIVDENNAVVEEVKTGRRRTHRDNSDKQSTHQLNTHSLSAHAS